MKDTLEESGECLRRQKLIETFRASKAKIKKWEKEASLTNGGSKPLLEFAPKSIQICYKNCKKIQYYLESKSEPKSEDIEPEKPLLPTTSTWGSHLNIANNAQNSEESVDTIDKPSVLVLSNSLGPSKVRSSLKRKKRAGINSSISILGNLNDDEAQESNKDSENNPTPPINSTTTTTEEERSDDLPTLKFTQEKPSLTPAINLTSRIDGGALNKESLDDSIENEGAPSKRARLDEEDHNSPPPEGTEELLGPPTQLSSNKEKLLAKKKNWNDNYRRINLKKKSFTRFNKGIARKREANANKARFKSKGKRPAQSSSSNKFNNQNPPENNSVWIPEPILTLSSCKATSTILEKTDEELESLVQDALSEFGHSDFRQGQKEAMLRVLRGKSTLVVLSTGSGKSLIYQIPAYLLGREDARLTIVVSPLVSLMEDQLRNMPPLIKADLLHSDISSNQLDKIKNDLRDNKLSILFMTPETLFSQLKILKEFIPRIGFVCVDEAHCMSQWSHNFRPAYFQLGGAIRDSLKTTTILGLTATATEKTIGTIAERIQVEPVNGIIKGSILRNNLLMSVSKDSRRDEALMDLLNSDKFRNLGSVIIYCTRREECERVAAIIRTRRRNEDYSKNNIIASSFHAGLSLAKRRKIYNDFIAGKLKIIVATIAFGMGINKSDIRGVVHYNMPSTLESYVQEIGRAGRDGEESYCHLFMDSKGKDLNELKRHVYSNSVDRVIVRKFVNCIFNDKTFSRNEEQYRDVVLNTYNLIELLDMPEENITTLMCYLENHEGSWIQVKRQISNVVKVQIYGSADKIRSKVSDHRALNYIIENKTSDGSYKVTDMAKELNWTCESVWDSLAKLKYAGASLDYGQPGFYLRVRNDVSENDLDDIQNLLCDKISEREKNEIHKLQRTFRTFLNVSHDSVNACLTSFDQSNCTKLNTYITEYFSEQPEAISSHISDSFATSIDEKPIRQQIRQFLSIYSDQTWTGRSIARIFHGIPSPNFPAQTWFRARGYWKAYMDVDFNVILRLATKEIIGLRTGLS